MQDINKNKFAKAVAQAMDKQAAYPFYEMVKDNSSLYTPNDPIGVQSADNMPTIEQMQPNLTGVDYETEFALNGLSAQYPNVDRLRPAE